MVLEKKQQMTQICDLSDLFNDLDHKEKKTATIFNFTYKFSSINSRQVN